MRLFTEEEVRRLFPMRDAVECMRRAFAQKGAGTAINQPRRRLILPNHSTLHQLAGSYGAYFGAKIYSTNPQHGAWFTVLLYDAESAKPLAQFEANHLGQIRTGAASGLATDLLAPVNASKLAVIGSGFQAKTQVDAIRTVRALTRVKIWSRDAGKRQRFAEQCREGFGLNAIASASAEEAIEDADIVVTATSSRTPVFESRWLKNTVLVNAMGSNYSDRREVPAETIRMASRLVADDIAQCKIEAGDLIMALQPDEWNGVRELSEFSTPEPASGITVFKSVGLGLEDVAAAAWIYEHAG
jgi:alanine dehydrogenase